jgi:hypothetical protein
MEELERRVRCLRVAVAADSHSNESVEALFEQLVTWARDEPRVCAIELVPTYHARQMPRFVALAQEYASLLDVRPPSPVRESSLTPGQPKAQGPETGDGTRP